MKKTLKDSCNNVFKNIHDNTLEEYYEKSPKEEEHACRKTTYDKWDYIDVTSLIHHQHFKLSTNLVKEYDKLKNNIINLKDYIEFLKNKNYILGE